MAQPMPAAVRHTLGMFHVWVDSWQMKCCGDPFGVGDTVRWTLAPYAEEVSLRDEAAVPIKVHLTHREEHHGGLPEEAPVTVGLVHRIRAVFFEYVEGANPLRAMVPKLGSGRVWERVDRVYGWERDGPAPGTDLQFDGYIVDLELGDRGD